MIQLTSTATADILRELALRTVMLGLRQKICHTSAYLFTISNACVVVGGAQWGGGASSRDRRLYVNMFLSMATKCRPTLLVLLLLLLRASNCNHHSINSLLLFAAVGHCDAPPIGLHLSQSSSCMTACQSNAHRCILAYVYTTCCLPVSEKYCSIEIKALYTVGLLYISTTIHRLAILTFSTLSTFHQGTFYYLSICKILRN